MDLPSCLAHLDEAIAAATDLALDRTAAVTVRETARTRLGFPSDALGGPG